MQKEHLSHYPRRRSTSLTTHAEGAPLSLPMQKEHLSHYPRRRSTSLTTHAEGAPLSLPTQKEHLSHYPRRTSTSLTTHAEGGPLFRDAEESVLPAVSVGSGELVRSSRLLNKHSAHWATSSPSGFGEFGLSWQRRHGSDLQHQEGSTGTPKDHPGADSAARGFLYFKLQLRLTQA
ncbi:uncharacterized protein LOC127667661 isoform X2 [Apodemus sylvaticus]|uniref:uncharacterized protein LOC127667661 isoform X2 n=1 Tax=Apodemus sylvaticus TaxID=10129 RepID=UPI002242DF14|nr:uncharacterized protein LOC127667661 isoform X2 [Apodemus sylvaticus]